MSRRSARLLPLVACIFVSACAPMPATKPVAQPGTVTSGGGAAPPTPPPAVVDSGPSADAQAVLATIPEPIDSSERVPAPEPGIAGADSTGDMPVPTETAPLGQGAGGDSLYAAPGSAPPPTTTPATSTPGATAGAAGAGAATATPKAPAGPCFRVQVAAPVDAGEADAKMKAANSLLLATFVVEKEGKLYKVRSRDCMDDAAATRLRDRAASNGFDGAFKIKVGK